MDDKKKVIVYRLVCLMVTLTIVFSTVFEPIVVLASDESMISMEVESEEEQIEEELEIKGPENIGVLDESFEGMKDGQITGVSDAMEYRKDGEIEYTQITGENVTDLEPGTYFVRFKATEDTAASLDVKVVISVGRKSIYAISVNVDKMDFATRELSQSTPKSKKVTVVNKGNRDITLIQPKAKHYDIGELSKKTLQPGKSATFSIRPKENLSVGTYKETIKIQSDRANTEKIKLSFEKIPDQLPDKKVSAKRIKQKEKIFNINSITKQSASQYSVLQGSCTDGKYVYYVMLKKTSKEENDRCKILKTRVSDNKTIKYSESMYLGHGNDITYNSDTRKLVVVHGGSKSQQISIVNPNTLKKEKTLNISIPKQLEGASATALQKIKGIYSIAYSSERQQYIAGIMGSNHYMILDTEFRPIKRVVIRKISEGTKQGLYADQRYIYSLRSHTGTGNSITIYDWEGHYIQKIIVPVYYEGESIYCIGNTLYMGVYRSYNSYYYTTHYKTKRVKWKKVNGKWKYKTKYVYKTKRVKWKKVDGKWKYKTYKVKETYKVKHKKFCRANYVYKLTN